VTAFTFFAENFGNGRGPSCTIWKRDKHRQVCYKNSIP